MKHAPRYQSALGFARNLNGVHDMNMATATSLYLSLMVLAIAGFVSTFLRPYF